MYPALFLIYFIPAVVILLASLASMVQFSLSYNRAGRVSAYIYTDTQICSIQNEYSEYGKE
jgi:hypothetical protein